MYVERSPDDTQPLGVPTATGWVVGLTAASLFVITIITPPFWDLAIAAARSFLIRGQG
jgi:hypothetical protein